jgi:hypothetical protein
VVLFAVSNPNTPLGNTTADTQGAWAITLSGPLTLSDLRFAVRVTDPADNLQTSPEFRPASATPLPGTNPSGGTSGAGGTTVTAGSAVRDVTSLLQVTLTRTKNRRRVVVRVRNGSGAAVAGPLHLLLDGLSRQRLKKQKVRVRPVAGFTSNLAPAGVPYLALADGLAPGQEVALTVTLASPKGRRVNFAPRVVAGPASLL